MRRNSISVTHSIQRVKVHLSYVVGYALTQQGELKSVSQGLHGTEMLQQSLNADLTLSVTTMCISFAKSGLTK